MGDFSTRYCIACEGEIVQPGEAITMYPGKKICHCKIFNNGEISLCRNCNCMTKSIDVGQCCKCTKCGGTK